MALKTSFRTSDKLPEAVRQLLQKRLLEEKLELPFLPDTSAQVLALCNEAACDARQLAELLQRDQSLAGHVLKVANSAAYAPKERIVSLQQAVSRLGISTICEIAIAVSLKGEVFRVPGQQVRIREMWIHSAAVAVYAKEVARILRKNVEGAFMCGLMHDGGNPLVMKHLIELVKERTDKPVPGVVIEGAMDEFHEYVGSLMIEQFGLPDWMERAVLFHHEYDQADQFRDEAMVTCLADRLTHWALSESTAPEDFDAEHPVLGELGVYAEDVVSLLDMRPRVLEVAEAFL